MNNFQFQNPTKLVYGKGQIAKLAELIPAGSKVMVTMGGGSIFKNGVYDQVVAALSGVDFIEFRGIEPNPEFETLLKGLAEAKAEGVNFFLAVGGGSVIDGTKFIATAMKYDGNPWEFMLDESKAVDALPLGTVLTLPATGSEMNNAGVVSRRDIVEKRAFHNPKAYPVFSILDPEAIFSLPRRQVSNGIVDTFAHTLEQYLTDGAERTMVMDRFAEGLMLTLVSLAPELLAEEGMSYDAAANYMLSATMGLNGFVSMGTVQDWATHKIGHELTALHGLDHGVTLAILHPALMDVMRAEKHNKLVQFAERVWGITEGSDEEKIDGAIAAIEAFYRSVGMKTKLSDYGIGEETIAEIVKRFTDRGWNAGERGIVTPEKVEAILRRAL